MAIVYMQFTFSFILYMLYMNWHFIYMVCLNLFSRVLLESHSISTTCWDMLICLRAVFILHPGHGSYIQLTIRRHTKEQFGRFARDERHPILRQVLEHDRNKHIEVVRTRDDDIKFETWFQQKKINGLEVTYLISIRCFLLCQCFFSDCRCSCVLHVLL